MQEDKCWNRKVGSWNREDEWTNDHIYFGAQKSPKFFVNFLECGKRLSRKRW